MSKTPLEYLKADAARKRAGYLVVTEELKMNAKPILLAKENRSLVKALLAASGLAHWGRSDATRAALEPAAYDYYAVTQRMLAAAESERRRQDKGRSRAADISDLFGPEESALASDNTQRSSADGANSNASGENAAKSEAEPNHE